MSVIVNEINLKNTGEWVACKLTDCRKMFFRHNVGQKYFGLGDKLGICPLCLFDKKMANGTIQNMRNVIVDYTSNHKYTEGKPGKDTL